MKKKRDIGIVNCQASHPNILKGNRAKNKIVELWTYNQQFLLKEMAIVQKTTYEQLMSKNLQEDWGNMGYRKQNITAQ